MPHAITTYFNVDGISCYTVISPQAITTYLQVDRISCCNIASGYNKSFLSKR